MFPLWLLWYVCVYKYILYIYTYTYICINTHTQTHTHIFVCIPSRRCWISILIKCQRKMNLPLSIRIYSESKTSPRLSHAFCGHYTSLIRADVRALMSRLWYLFITRHDFWPCIRIFRLDRWARRTVDVFLKVLPVLWVGPQNLTMGVMTKDKINLNHQIQMKIIPKTTYLITRAS